MTALRRRIAAALLLATATAMAPGAAAPVAAATTAERCYTAALHEVFLDRPPSLYDLQSWVDRVQPLPVRPTLPQYLASSSQWLTAVVVGIYDDALDREPSEEDLELWTRWLREGTRVTTITYWVYGSDEVWDRAGGTAEGFVADVFPRIMGRSPSSADVAYWAGEVPTRGRGGVAKALVGSIENRRARVTGLYAAILGRAPDTAGRDYWAGRLATMDDVRLAVELAASPEAFQRAQVGCSVPPAPSRATIVEGNRSARAPRISGDGRYLAFTSMATDLVPGDEQDQITDVFTLDRTTGTITKVSDSGRDVINLAMSGDGRHVVYASWPSQDEGAQDVLSWDRQTGTTTRITAGDHDSGRPRVSADGAYVTFLSRATDLVEPHETGLLTSDLFVWERATGTIQRLTHGEEDITSTAISPDGSVVAFVSKAPPLGGPSHFWPKVYRWQRSDGSITEVGPGSDVLDVATDGDVLVGDGMRLLLVDSTSGEGTVVAPRGASASAADITPDGSTVVFNAEDAGLAPGDTNSHLDVYVWERATGTVVRLSGDDAISSRATTSDDGRYVAFHSSPRFGPAAYDDIVLWDRGI